MKKRKNIAVKIMASIALLAIVIGIVGTGALVIVQGISGPSHEITQQELQQYIESLSGSVDIGSGQVLELESLIESSEGSDEPEQSNEETSLEFSVEAIDQEEANDGTDALTPVDVIESLE